jgi:hypothetical protein
MFKRLMTLAVAVVALTAAGCSSSGRCGSSCGTKSASTPWLHCEPPCYGKNLKRSSRQMMDFVDVYFLNYDRHDPFRCDPCLGD